MGADSEQGKTSHRLLSQQELKYAALSECEDPLTEDQESAFYIGFDAGFQAGVESVSELLEKLLDSDGHTHDCSFTACSCERSKLYQAARSEAANFLASLSATGKETE